MAYLSVEVYREEGYIYLDDLSVTAEYRNQGIGTKLISLAEDYAESTGIPAIVLHVEKTNEKAHELYRKRGYSDYEDQGKRIKMVKSSENNSKYKKCGLDRDNCSVQYRRI